MSRVLYHTEGDGRWVKRAWAPQCRAEVFLFGVCQGTEAHVGLHWVYGPDGSYHWAGNPTGEAGSTPPGHASYISPVDRREDFHVNFFTDTEITDPDLIARLESDDNEDVDGMVSKPCSQEEIDWLEANGRLPEGVDV